MSTAMFYEFEDEEELDFDHDARAERIRRNRHTPGRRPITGDAVGYCSSCGNRKRLDPDTDMCRGCHIKFRRRR